ncbi:hypothetical protein XENORESO_018484 [Xenotaenia resolanae]|uniref:Integrase core domain-containing protein n=1 Tax=Xenotaenia resolanae TaxID=208358 RepID=A0ABV0WN32_9TELE
MLSDPNWVQTCLPLFVQIMYLEPATNNRSSTALTFFPRAVENYGWPSRIERLWQDAWSSVTYPYYEDLHNLEESGLLDLSNILQLFCAHYMFLPGLADALQTFIEGWDNPRFKSEGGLTPNQLWILGHIQKLICETKHVQNLELYGTD